MIFLRSKSQSQIAGFCSLHHITTLAIPHLYVNKLYKTIRIISFIICQSPHNYLDNNYKTKAVFSSSSLLTINSYLNFKIEKILILKIEES